MWDEFSTRAKAVVVAFLLVFVSLTALIFWILIYALMDSPGLFVCAASLVVFVFGIVGPNLVGKLAKRITEREKKDVG